MKTKTKMMEFSYHSEIFTKVQMWINNTKDINNINYFIYSNIKKNNIEVNLKKRIKVTF
jgi:hypothetical protein